MCNLLLEGVKKSEKYFNEDFRVKFIRKYHSEVNFYHLILASLC